MSKDEDKEKMIDTSTKKDEEKKKEKDNDKMMDDKGVPLSEGDVKLILKYGKGPYNESLKKVEGEVEELNQKIVKIQGIKESDTGLSQPSQWNPQADKELMGQDSTLMVGRCTKIINPGNDAQYMVNLKHYGKYVVGLGKELAPTDIEEGMRVGVQQVHAIGSKINIILPLPPKIDASVTMMQVEEKPDVTYNDIGGCKDQIEKIREIVELPLLHPERFVTLGIDPPKGVLLYGPPGTGKTLTARAVANRTDATFIRVIGSELVQRYVGEGARMVREIFNLARTKKSCVLFFDEVDAVGTTRYGEGDSEVQRTMLEIVNQLDGFDSRGNIKVLMATNRPDTLDPALARPGRLDRKIEFTTPDLEGRVQIFKINAKSMAVDPDVRYELVARLTPNATGADIRSVCTEAGMFAIRARRKSVSEKDLMEAIDKVIKGHAKFSATSKYMVYN